MSKQRFILYIILLNTLFPLEVVNDLSLLSVDMDPDLIFSFTLLPIFKGINDTGKQWHLPCGISCVYQIIVFC